MLILSNYHGLNYCFRIIILNYDVYFSIWFGSDRSINTYLRFEFRVVGRNFFLTYFVLFNRNLMIIWICSSFKPGFSVQITILKLVCLLRIDYDFVVLKQIWNVSIDEYLYNWLFYYFQNTLKILVHIFHFKILRWIKS